MQKHLKTLIIGQGLAGTLLAYRLIQSGVSVLVMDQGHHQSSSMAAAGLVNPVTGKRIAKSWLLETLYPEAMHLYAELGHVFGTRFFHECAAIRLYKDEAERERVALRRNDPEYDHWLSRKDVVNTPSPVGMRAGVAIEGAGWVDFPQLLNALKAWLIEKDAYRTGRFEMNTLSLSSPTVHWQEMPFERVIFCDGYQAMNNPLFSWLPFKPARGEILSLQTPIAPALENTLINQGKWLLPIGGNKLKVGATYSWDPLHCEPTVDGKMELLDAYQTLLPGAPAPDIIEHKAGVRPATLDAKPFVGKHPKHPNIMLFNGFGSKGSLLIPYFSKHFSQVILGETSLMPEVDIHRYCKT